MVTEPLTDGLRTPLQDLQTLYIGGAELAVVRRACVGYIRPGQFSLCAVAKEVNDHDGAYHPGVGSKGTSTRLNDE